MRDFGIELFELWTDMWNLNLDRVEQIMAPEFTLRYAQPGADVYDDIHDRKALATQVAAFHGQVPGVRFSSDGVPVVEMNDSRTGIVARPYRATMTDGDGGERVLHGTDILRAENGLIVEVWSVSGGPGGRSFYAAN
ncbi:nuclear transport factor 2 family protein [Nocardia sp. NPDC088792]|uniref:nuclear transport factor 2 family protein n=1 Tax=Nocardia sp. NPDC088792 TaxID=3364332 RepID=UPI0038054EA6